MSDPESPYANDDILTPLNRERYQRQLLVIGEEGQRKLGQMVVLQVGAGGLGAPLSLYLVSSGIGELILFESDVVSLSNLGRQVLYSTPDVGASKAELAKQRLEQLNPNVKITIIKGWLTHDSVQPFIHRVNYLVDASDNFETKFLINDLGLEYNIPFTIAGIQSYEGQLMSVIPHKSACYRCIFGAPLKTDKSKPIPVMSPTCGVVGSLQAAEVIKGLLNQNQRILNNLLLISLDFGDFQKIPIKINPNCLCQTGKF